MKHTKWLVFKSCRGLDRPWLVFSPEERKTSPESVWNRGFSSWQEALAYVQAHSWEWTSGVSLG